MLCITPPTYLTKEKNSPSMYTTNVTDQTSSALICVLVNHILSTLLKNVFRVLREVESGLERKEELWVN